MADLPTTNGAWAAGEGIKLGTALGAALLHMDQVQVGSSGAQQPCMGALECASCKHACVLLSERYEASTLECSLFDAPAALSKAVSKS